MTSLPILARRLPVRQTIDRPLSAFESETQAVLVRTTPYSEHLILYVLAGIIVLSFALMAVVKLDRVVTGGGKIVATEGSLFIQPLPPALVSNILVKMGDVVKKDQVLARLDPTFAAADLTALKQKRASSQAAVDRLSAERAGLPYEPAENNPPEMLQAALWRQRQAEYKQNIANFDSQIRGLQSTIAGAQRDVQAYGERLKFASKVETMHTTLEEHGYGSKLNSTVAADSRSEIARLLGDSQSSVQMNQHNLDALTAQRGVFTEKWQDDLATALVDAQNLLDQTRQDLVKAEKTHDLVTLTAPEDAVVVKIGAASVGSVIDSTTSEPLFTLTPLRGALETEINVLSADVGFIRIGDHVELKVDAYPFMRHGTVKGTIKTISEGSFTLDANNQPTMPYYKVRIAITDTKLRDVPDGFRLIPGMSVAGDVLVGKRTLLSYIVEGGLKTGSEAMREP
jgi:HlyD family type I secretion membrane fusion protein